MPKLLVRYQSIFHAPTILPLAKAHDHWIILEPNTGPTNIRPYQYPYIQKNEIERVVKEMLTTGIIRPIFNPFSSPVLLVKRKDGSWRFCVNYRAFNQVTIKDRYCHRRTIRHIAWSNILHQIRSQVRVPSNLSKTKRCLYDCFSYPRWPLRFLSHTIWPNQRPSDVPILNE